MRALLFAIVFLAISSSLDAGQYNPALAIGDPAPAWKNLPGVDGKNHSLADLANKRLVVVVFTCNSCPIACDYEDRIIAFAKAHAADVALVAINVNRVPEDSLEKMQERAKEKSFTFPYLYDASQQIAKDYGATFTPEFFVLSPERKIVYMGGMDDSSDPAAIKHQYLEPAIQAALAGQTPEVTETVARGCRVRYARERR
jgi:peroxiredoxin